MFRVAVVDDEDLIVQGLVRTMPWAKYHCEVIATASDGMGAIQMIANENPDILFTDINMPRMDGLSMLAAVRSEHPNMQITILSGYPNFEYAQRAISLGVARYVLKPSKFAELEEALACMVQTVQAQQAKRAETERKVHSVEDQAKRNADVMPSIQASAKIVADDKASVTATDTVSVEDCTQSVEPLGNPVENAQNFIVHNAKEYIRAHYAEKLTLNDVAEQVYVSQWHLSKLISRYTKQSFFDLLNTARIDRAKELLADPSLRVWEISEQVGFSEVTHFSRIFKKMVGMSANEYRAQKLCGTKS